MFTIAICLAGVLLILVVAEALWRLGILRGESQRKLVHICTGSFIASWPWLMSWRAIQIIGILMAVVVAANRLLPVLHFSERIRRKSYGDVVFALAVFAAAALTVNKIYFAIAILHMSLADGLAALVGKKYGRYWRYKVFNQTKTVIGSMTFWFTSFCVLGVGLLFQATSTYDYILALIFLPPILTAVENFMVWGLDNLAVPLVALLALSLLN